MEGRPDLPQDPQARWRDLARGFFETLAELDAPPPGAAVAAAPPHPPRPSEQGTSISALHTGLNAARSRDPGWRTLALLPRAAAGSLADLARHLAALEGEGYASMRDLAAEVAAAVESGAETAAREALARLPVYEVLYLPPWLRRRFGGAVAAMRLANAARRALAGELEAAHGELGEVSLLGQQEPWLLEALLALAWLGLEGGEAGRGTAEAALGLLAGRVDNASMEEEFYHRYHQALLAAGRPPEKAAALAFRAALRRPIRDPRQLERLALISLSHAPGDPVAHHLLGATLFLEGDAERAHVHLGAAVAAGREAARLLYGLSLIEEGRRDEGLAALLPLLEGEQPPREALLAAAEAAYERGEPDKALELLQPVEDGGEPYRSRASTLRAWILMDRGDLDAAHRTIHDALDACDPKAVAAYTRLSALHGERGDEARRTFSAAHADEMRTLPPVRQLFAFVTSPVGQPLIVSRDAGGATYGGVHRATGRQVLIRVRRAVPREQHRPPAVVGAPWFLEVIAADTFADRRHTVFLNPGGTPLARVSRKEGKDKRDFDAIRRALMISLAAAAAEAAARGLVIGWLTPERLAITAEGAPALMPFDPYDDPRPKEGGPPPATLAPELVAGGAPAASAATDVFAIGKIGQLIYGGEPLGPALEQVLEAATSSDPAARPTPHALLEELIASAF